MAIFCEKKSHFEVMQKNEGPYPYQNRRFISHKLKYKVCLGSHVLIANFYVITSKMAIFGHFL